MRLRQLHITFLLGKAVNELLARHNLTQTIYSRQHSLKFNQSWCASLFVCLKVIFQIFPCIIMHKNKTKVNNIYESDKLKNSHPAHPSIIHSCLVVTAYFQVSTIWDSCRFSGNISSTRGGTSTSFWSM